jgi:LmbE family N-acetylglucosaminyl deacetylase
MLIAPHPDDEALACSVILQRAVGAGAAIRVVYATDGENNPWPQRVIERKWRLNGVDRKRWGELRRAEALAALAVLGINTSSVSFLALPDQQMSDFLISRSQELVRRFSKLIALWGPTHLFVPSISDTHPDHNSLAVMLRVSSSELVSLGEPISIWSYVVHGRSPAFFDRAEIVRQSAIETAVKLRAINCHKTQLKLSKRRFLAYALRPERFLSIGEREDVRADGPIIRTSRRETLLGIKIQLSPKLIRARATIYVLGHDCHANLRCLGLQLPVHDSLVEIFDCVNESCLGSASYRGDALIGELTVPINLFSPAHALFIKLEQWSWFFDEAGWLEMPAEQLEPAGAVELRNNGREAVRVRVDTLKTSQAF